MNKGGNSVQRVKQKMRMKLHPQGLQFGLSESRLQFQRFAFALLRAPKVSQRVNDADDHPVDRNVDTGFEDRGANYRGPIIVSAETGTIGREALPWVGG